MTRGKQKLIHRLTTGDDANELKEFLDTASEERKRVVSELKTIEGMTLEYKQSTRQHLLESIELLEDLKSDIESYIPDIASLRKEALRLVKDVKATGNISSAIKLGSCYEKINQFRKSIVRNRAVLVFTSERLISLRKELNQVEIDIRQLTISISNRKT